MTGSDLHPEIDDREKDEILDRGIELFNDGEHFESHEAFEEIWRSTNPEPRDLFQGLVQVAAGLHHWLVNGRPGPAARVLGRGVVRLESLAPAAMGVDLEALLVALEPWSEFLAAPSGMPPPMPRIRRRRGQGWSEDSLAHEPAGCPWCGERIEMTLDPSAAAQEYVEDCPVCCRSFLVVVRFDPDGPPSVELRREE